jgi:PmbA protein
MAFDAEELLTLARAMVRQAAPGEAIEVVASRSTGTSAKVYRGDIESLTTATSASFGVRVIADHRQGYASAGSHDPELLAGLLDEARDNARYGEPDEHLGIAEPDGVDAVTMDLWRDDVVTTPTAHKIDLARELEAAVLAGDPRVTGVRNASYADGAGGAVLVTSNGIEVSGGSTWCSVSASALASDDGSTQIGYAADVGRRLDELDLTKVADDAVVRATRLLGAVKPASSRVAMVLEPRLVATILGFVATMCSGERLLKGRTAFAGREGEQLASPRFNLVDDPTDPRSFGADPHDDEGLATRANVLFADGVFRGFLHNSYTARRLGVRSTANAVRSGASTPGVGTRALSLAPGHGTLDDLIAGVDSGVLVQSFHGLHSGVNAVSGDFSVGVDGLMIRNGRLAEPFREATVASTLPRMLADIVAVGADTEWLNGGTTTPSLVIDALALSGT